MDEDIELRIMLGLLLSGEGHDVSQADNREQAIALFCRRPLDLVITELKLGGKDGFEIIVEMRREPHHARFIALARTGWMSADLISARLKDLGAQAIFAKPFPPEQLLPAVQPHWAEHRLFNMFKLPCTRRILLVDEDIALRTVLGFLLAEEGYDVYQADNGEQAISLYARRPFDLVVTELKLGGRDGFEVMTEMQRELVCDRFIATARAGWLPAGLCTRVAEHFGAHAC